MRIAAMALATVLCTGLAPAEGRGVVKLKSIRLYLTDERLRDRVGDDVEPLAKYIEALKREAGTFWGAANPPGVKGLLVAVGVRADGKSRAWCEAVGGEVPAEKLDKFRAALEKVRPVHVRNGPIAFAMELGLFDQMPAEFPVAPQAWSDAAKKAKKPLLVPDGLFEVIWPE